MAFSVSLTLCGGRTVAQSDSRSWLAQRHIPERPGMRTSPAKLLIIDPVAQHDTEADGQHPGHRHLGDGSALAEDQAAIGALEPQIGAAGGLCGLHQQKAHQAIALFGQVSEALAPGGGILLRNQSQVTGQVLVVGKPFRRTQHQNSESPAMVGSRQEGTPREWTEDVLGVG